MAISRQVTCINKNDRLSRWESITYIGGDWGKTSQPQAIREIEDGTYSYYVNVRGNKVKVIVAVHSGNKYLKTEADTTTVDNLLSLQECK